MYHVKDTDILTANASLYIVGDWTSVKDKSTFFERELLLVTFDNFDLNAKLMSGEKIGAGGIYNNIIKSHKTSSGVIVVDECTLDALLLTLTPAQDDCYFK